VAVDRRVTAGVAPAVGVAVEGSVGTVGDGTVDAGGSARAGGVILEDLANKVNRVAEIAGGRGDELLGKLVGDLVAVQFYIPKQSALGQ
jgi:hypothetical protein